SSAPRSANPPARHREGAACNCSGHTTGRIVEVLLPKLWEKVLERIIERPPGEGSFEILRRWEEGRLTEFIATDPAVSVRPSASVTQPRWLAARPVSDSSATSGT